MTRVIAGEAGGRRLAVQDRLGSVGSYFPYGEARSGTNPLDTWSFATYWRDSATSLDYADQRYYSNQFGRFMSPDPYQAGAGSGDPTNQGSSSLRMAIAPKPSKDASACIAAATCSANSRTECGRPVATFQVAIPPFSRQCASARTIASTTSSI